MKKFDAVKNVFDKMILFVLSLYFNPLLPNKGFVSAQIVHARGNQLIPELLLKPSDTLHTQNIHIEHLLEEV